MTITYRIAVRVESVAGTIKKISYIYRIVAGVNYLYFYCKECVNRPYFIEEKENVLYTLGINRVDCPLRSYYWYGKTVTPDVRRKTIALFALVGTLLWL